jgi:hypothetical protein
MKLSLQVKDMQEKYQKAQEAYTRVTEWKDIHHNSPETLPIYSNKKRIRDLDSWIQGWKLSKILRTPRRRSV